MAPVDSMFRTIFCAVPAFMREEPATASGPTSVTIVIWAALASSDPGLHVTATVLAPRARAYLRAATVYGVRPLAARPTTTSLAPGAFLRRSRRPSSLESSLASTAAPSARLPPAMTYCTCRGEVLKVGGHSA